jgi:hypothetical protein
LPVCVGRQYVEGRAMNRMILIAAVRRLLRPVVRVMLRNGVGSDEFESVAREVFVDVAEHDFALPNRKQTDSRISVLTGLSRRQVALIRKRAFVGLDREDAQHNRAERVITGWLREDDFLDDHGDPRILPLEGATSFDSLVKRFAGDVPSRAVADELLRIGNVEMLENGELQLLSRGYTPKPLSDEVLVLFGTHAADFLSTWDRNLSVKNRNDLLYQRQVSYRYIPLVDMEEFKQLSSTLGQRVLEDLDRWLDARQGASADPDTLRLGLGIYQIRSSNEGEDGHET